MKKSKRGSKNFGGSFVVILSLSVLIAGWFIFFDIDLGFSLSDAEILPITKPHVLKDFNYDGKPDLIWRNTVTGQLEVWFMDGSKKIGSSPFKAPGVEQIGQSTSSKWQIVGMAEFDPPRTVPAQTDLVWWNGSTGQVVLWNMDGVKLIKQTELIASFGTLFPNRVIVGVADFNKDGLQDLLSESFGLKLPRLKVHYNNNGQFTESSYIGTYLSKNPYDLIVQGVSDFYSDGWPDIVLRYADGKMELWKMKGEIVGSVIPLQKIGDAQRLVEDVSDFNRDGKPDLFWRYYANGTNGIWFLDGASRKNGSPVEARTDLQWSVQN